MSDTSLHDIIRLSVASRAQIADCAWPRRLLELQAEHRPDQLVVDLSRLPSMDWWVALVLLWVGRAIDREGGTLVLESPQPAVARLLNATMPASWPGCISVPGRTDGGPPEASAEARRENPAPYPVYWS